MRLCFEDSAVTRRNHRRRRIVNGVMHMIAFRAGGARRGFVVAAAAALTFLAITAQALYDPRPAFACSCITPLPSLAQVASEPNTVIVAGTVAQQFPERTSVTIDTWFWGAAPVDTAWLSFGSQMTTSCDPFVTVGERRLLVMSRQEADLFSVNPCVQSGVIGTPDGDAALAAAEALFEEVAPPTPSPTAPPESPPPATIDPGWLYVGGVVGGATLLLLAIALIAIRRRPTT